MRNARQVVILGHSGFIGSHLETALQAKNLHVVGRSLPEVDLSDAADFLNIAAYFTPDTTIILVAAVKRQFGDSLDAFRMNLAIAENVCDLLMKKPVRQVIYFSSAAVYGEETHNVNINEETQINATSYYGLSKYASERLLDKAVTSCTSSSSLICLRPPLIYGPGDKGRTYGPAGFAAAAVECSPITLWGDGTELREFIYVGDICNIVLRLINVDFSGVLNTVSGTRYCFADITNLLSKKFPCLQVTSRERSKQKADNAFFPGKIYSVMGNDFLFTTLEEGLDKTLLYNVNECQ